MKFNFTKPALTLLMLAGLNSPGFAKDLTTEIPLGITNISKERIGISPEQSTNFSAWKSFTQKNGAWSAVIDPITQTPTRAFGEGIKIKGFEKITESNIEQAVWQFVNEYAAVLNVNPANLVIQRKDFVNSRWYVTLKQVYQGVEVLNSEVELRIFENGNIPAFGVKYFNDINISTQAKISGFQAANLAYEGITKSTKFESSLASDKTYILPVPNGTKYDYKLVYRCNVNNNIDKFVSYVDANAGKVVWRYNSVMKSNVNLKSKGTVKEKFATDNQVEVNLANMYVTVNGNVDTLDHAGLLTKDYTLPATISANLEGRYVRVISTGRNTAAFSGTITNPGDFKIEFNDANSHRYERNMFYYSNNLHEFFRTLDPSMKVLDKQFYVELQYLQDNMGMGANAYSTGDTIVFLDVHLTDMLMADGPGVFYHEFGHSVNKLFYDAKNGGLGMINAACNEGTADINCAMLIDSPEIGHGVYAADTNKVIRTCKNTLKYPVDVTGESHDDGRILAGAFWDIRELTDLATLRKLAHFSRYGLPDDNDFGTSCMEWFVETLVADDDDGNLANGTPHMSQIITGFNNHNIGMNLLVSNSFTHTPLSDAKADAASFPVKFTMANTNATLLKLDSTFVSYRTISPTGKSGVKRIPAISSGTDYTAVIPAQAKGTIVEYWFEIIDALSKSTTKIFESNSTEEPFKFLVGFNRAIFDGYATKTWTIGSTDDDAKKGKWEYGIPQAFKMDEYGEFKPGTDYANDGSKCYVTGVKSPTVAQIESNPTLALMTYALNGQTTLTSPVYDASKYEFPVVKVYDFFKYFAIPQFAGNYEGLPSELYLESSNDNGDNWTRIKNFNSISGWKSNIIPLTGAITDKMQFRLIANTQVVFGYPVAFACATVDNFEILTTNDITSVEDASNTEAISALPNPFAESVSINLGDSPCSIKIFNQFGSLVYSNDNVSGNLIWNGADMSGAQVSDGSYYYTIKTSGDTKTGKFIRIK